MFTVDVKQILQGYKIISGSKIVSEQTACMCRLILDFRFIFSQDYDIWEQDIHVQADLSLHF